jgi:hypothetical protein
VNDSTLNAIMARLSETVIFQVFMLTTPFIDQIEKNTDVLMYLRKIRIPFHP